MVPTVSTLSKPDLDAFLQTTSIVAILATIDAEGTPYQVPVWYEWDGTHLWIVSKPRAEYVLNLKRNPTVSVCIATQTLPYVRVLVQGTATLIDTDDDWLPMGYRMAERYLGKQEGDAYIDKTKHWRRVYIRISPTRMKSWDGGATGHAWGARYIEPTR
jgi:PPOX class probable F420-dependent enzyme